MQLRGTVLVTGGAGFIARALYQRALNEHWPAQFVIYSRDDGKHRPVLERFPNVTKAIRGDVCFRYSGDGLTPFDLAMAEVQPDAVIHAAASKYVDLSESNAWDTYRVNVLGSASVALACARAQTPLAIAISTDKACLDYFAPVRLANGRTVRIAKLVHDQCDGEVVTLANDGLRTARITGWHKNQRAGRTMLGLSYEHAHQHRGQSQRAWLTEDHLVLTPDGWIPAAALRTGDHIVTGEEAPNARQFATTVGCLLGDAFLTRNGSGRARLQTSHGNRDQEWQDIVARLPHSAGAALGQMREHWYPSGKKIVCRRDVLDAWSAQMLAAWYMDDGCVSRTNGGRTYHARLATHGFSVEDVQWLADQLTLHGFPAHVLMVRVGKWGPYPETRLTADASARFFAAIGPYVMGHMRRKLPDWAPPYEERHWRFGPSLPYIAPVKVTKGDRPRRNVYCLDVEGTHNFVAGGVIVHNCMPVNTYGATKLLMERLWQEAARWNAASRFVVARYGNVIGSTGSALPRMRQQVRAGEQVTVTNPDMTRFWMTSGEAIDTILAAADAPSGTVTVYSARASSLLTAVHGAVGDMQYVQVGDRAGEKAHETLLTSSEAKRALKEGPFWTVLAPTVKALHPAERFELRSDRPLAGNWSAAEIAAALDEAEHV